MSVQFRVDLYDAKGKKLKSTLFSKALSFHLYVKVGAEYIRATEERYFFPAVRIPVSEKIDVIDTFKLVIDEEFTPAAQAHKPAKQKVSNRRKSQVVRKEKPFYGDIVLGYPPLDPPRKVSPSEKKVIRGQVRLTLLEEFGLEGIEAEDIIDAMFKAFNRNIPLIPKMLEEFMIVYYFQNKKDRRSQVKRLLTGKEISTEIQDRIWLKGELSQIDTLLKLSLIKVEKETTRKLKNGSVVEELKVSDHLFAKVIATYRGNMEMSVDDIGGSAWRDTVFDAVITDILNVFEGFVDNGVFEYSRRPEYIIRIICPLFDRNYGVKEALKTGSGNMRYGLGISLDRTFFESIEDVDRHLQRPNAQRVKTPELDRTSLFDRVKNRMREYLRLNNLNTFAITGFTIERLIYE